MTYEEIVKRIDDGLNKRGIYHESFEKFIQGHYL